MSLDTFTPPLTPSSGTADKPEVKVLQADFGDGYSQTSYQLNNIRRVLTLKWDVLTIAQAQAILDFFIMRRGATPFLYRVPGEDAAIQWTCKDWQQGFAAASYRSVTATLRQDFSLAA